MYRYFVANIRWIMEKAREFQKNIYFCFIDYAKAFDCVDHNKLWKILQFSSVQLLNRVRLFATPWFAGRQASLSITNSQSSLRLTSIESVIPSSYLILCRPLILLPPIPPSIRVFSNESTLCMRWPSTEVSALASFRSKKSQADLLHNGLVGSPCSPRDSQESSPTPQFKSINSYRIT